MQAINKILRTPSAFVLLLVAIVSLIGIVIKSNSDEKIARLPIEATLTAEARLTAISSTLTPVVLTSTPIIMTPTITSLPILLSSPEVALIPTNTFEPTALPTPDIHLGIENGCIDQEFWTLYDGTGISADNNGCWKLSDWGFFAQDKVLYFLPPRNPDNQSHGLYTYLSGNVDINFNFLVDKIQTGTSQANIRFGIVPANINNGKFLAYHFLPQYPDFLYPKLWQDGHYGNPLAISLNKGKTQKVTISIRENFLTIFLDNQKVVENMVLRFDERLFSIDYYLPSNGELSANVSEFSIEKK